MLNQTVTVECIVVDDGSTDNTDQILQDYKDQITILSHQSNLGVSAARNTGIKAASNDWVSFLDSDDEWLSTKLKNQIDYLAQHPFFSIIQSEEKWIRNGRHLNKKKYHQKLEGFIFKNCLERCLISPSSVTIHRSVFDQFGYFDTDLPACEDYDLWLRLSRHLLIGLDKACSLIKYGGHPDQLSTATVALDQFRIMSLDSAYKNEISNYLKSEIDSLLTKKRSIYLNGLEKRKN